MEYACGRPSVFPSTILACRIAVLRSASRDCDREICRPLQEKPKTIISAQERYMAHTHGNEYQIAIVHQDGTEELSGWMNSDEQVAQTMARAHRTQGNAYWLRERNVFCLECSDMAQEIMFECRITDIPSPRYHPHDSGYLLAVGSRTRWEFLEAVIGSRSCGRDAARPIPTSAGFSGAGTLILADRSVIW